MGQQRRLPGGKYETSGKGLKQVIGVGSDGGKDREKQ
jgi:hypothetical protein